MQKTITTLVVLAAAALAAYIWFAGGDDGAPARQGMNPEDRPPVAVVTTVAKSRALVDEVEALGTTRAREAVEITSRISSVITAINFREGETVEAGTILVELDNAEERAALAEAEARVIDSRAQFRRARELLASKTVSESQVTQLEATMNADEARLRAAQARLEQTLIRAPFAGRVGLRQVSPGSLVNPTIAITTLDDVSSVRLDFTVPETFLGVLATGQRIAARSVAFEDRLFQGEVRTINTRVDPVTRAVTIRADLPNDDGLLKPGMFLTVRLAGQSRERVVIPEAALVPEGDRQNVYLVRDGRAWRTEVSVGRRLPGEVEILDGVRAGDEIVVEGTQKVANGGRVTSAEPIAVLGRS
ncbi:efflux RND transporter periplasmic adaptor subunit [Thioalkalivibrio sp. XN279]|uniref:efflux RND transporter periplasmic adaptor subunit n=1 Tax=Thioalkalivibrio sp. XN279 TaxID=2714953 RepID=UPI00140948E4|nr:efflux RND transporter periplasmic adaptor subunit [Thioalkalivibrio sp. XN279]NHA15402.1 efflux RND transporter periplasmic adaptor subunit [Thioalkalivibrio sp. XN279]